MMNRWIAFVLIFLAYLALSANFEWRNWIIGLVIAGAILWLLPIRHKPLELRRAPRRIWKLAKYFIRLTLDSLLSGLEVVRIVFSPRIKIRSAVVAIPCPDCSRMSMALSAHALTLAPGEMVITIDEDNLMYTHVLNVKKNQEGEIIVDIRRCQYLWEFFEEESGGDRLE